MAAANYGTLSWARASDGMLSRREKLREVAKGIGVVLSTAPSQIRERLGFRNPRAFDFNLDELVIPDAQIAKEAEEVCREASNAMLYNHCWRTYAWAMILGRRDGLKPDPELLYVATMLHDLALTERFGDYSPMPCFGARAGILGGRLDAERGWPEHRCATVGDAISLHLNASVPAHHGRRSAAAPGRRRPRRDRPAALGAGTRNGRCGRRALSP